MPLISDGPPEEGGFRAGPVIGPDGERTGEIVCFPSFSPNCIVVVKPSKTDVKSTGFLSPGEPTGFHDRSLMNATARINEILAETIENHDGKDGNLHVITMPEGPMLAWVKQTTVNVEDIRTESASHHHRVLVDA